MTGGETFNQEFLHELTQCFATLHIKLPNAINAQWNKFKTYAASDPWKRCSTNCTGCNQGVCQCNHWGVIKTYFEIFLNA